MEITNFNEFILANFQNCSNVIEDKELASTTGNYLFEHFLKNLLAFWVTVQAKAMKMNEKDFNEWLNSTGVLKKINYLGFVQEPLRKLIKDKVNFFHIIYITSY